MQSKENINVKLQAIATELSQIVKDEEIKVVINSNIRTISFLEHSFSIPNPTEKEKYVATWEEIFSVFRKEKKKIEDFKRIEIYKREEAERIKKEKEELERKREELERKKEELERKKREEQERLSYTQNLSYIQTIIQNNSELQPSEKEKPKEVIAPMIKTEGFKYGVKISSSDTMQSNDWYELEKENTEFVILTALKNGRVDRKFKNYLKKCREHNLCYGAFFEGDALNVNEARKEFLDIISFVETYDINGPILYEINNNEVNKFENEVESMSKESAFKLKEIVDACRYILESLNEKGYKAALNIDLPTITVLVNSNMLTIDELPLIYNVLPSQTAKIDDSCQIIEFNPKNDYEKVKLSEKLFNENVINQ